MFPVHSYYSFKYGTSSPEEVVDLAVANDYDMVLLSDINSTAGTINFVRIAQKRGLKPIVGIDFRNGVAPCFLALAKSPKGYAEINAYLSEFLHSGKSIPERAPEFKDVFVIYPFAQVSDRPEMSLEPYEYVGVHHRDLVRLSRSGWAKRRDKLVMYRPFSFQNKRQFNAHRLLRAIDKNTLLSMLPKSEEGSPEDVWIHRNELMAVYGEFPQLIANTIQVLQECRISFEFGDAYPHKNQRTYTGSLEEDNALIRKLCDENLSYRYPNAGEDVHRRLEMELEVISQKQFVSYFLINWDITKYAREQGYFYVGRGSGANSMVAYVLRITDVDPIELDLYFERFINLYRKNPPDFDLDFSWRDRPDVTRYIFERFPHVSLLATYNTFQYRAVVRELGKVFGLPKAEIDVLTTGKFDASKLDELSVLVLRYSQLIHGFPSHLSIHAGGILISDQPIANYSPTWMPPKGFPTVQFDMVVAEDIGLYKFDILGQRGLGKIKDGLAIVAENNPDDPAIDIHDIKRFKEDKAVAELVRNGDAIGCFYVESPAMRMLMRKLQVKDYLGLVAASSVIRPGVARSGMMREFILRYRFPEKRDDAHPIMQKIMPDTYGVMVYQEDVIKVAHYFAGLTLGEADVLRRGMSGKFRSREEFAKARDKFFSNCIAKGYTQELTAEVWRQIESFAGYAFAKGHSASYAVESYQSLFLKAHYPLEYMVATINNGGGFYSREFYLHEARMKGGKILAPCINTSLREAVIRGKQVFLGFGMIHALEDETVYRILKSRRDGDFESLEDFLDRVPIGVEQIDLLIRIDAFRFTGKHKRALLWEARFKIDPMARKDWEQPDLFKEPRKTYELPSLARTAFEDAFDQIELLGFPLIDPFELTEGAPVNCVLAESLPALIGRDVEVLGYLVTRKTTTTVKGDRMAFGNFTDARGAFLDTVHFPDIIRRYPFRGRGVYHIRGRVIEEFDCISIEVSYMERVKLIEDPRYADLRKAEAKG